MRPSLVRLVLACCLAAAAPALAAPKLELTMYPQGPLFPHPLESTRGLQSLMLHNAAVINAGDAPATIASVELSLLRGGEEIERRTLRGVDLERIAARGAQLEAAGALDAFAFQFGDALGAPRARLAATPTLAPGDALLIGGQVLAWSGERDTLRIEVRAMPGDARAEIRVPLAVAPPEARYAFPIAGRTYVQAGATLHTHHRWAVPEEFALDICMIGEGGRTHRGDGARFADYYAYGTPVRAAADGEVIAIVSDRPEDLAQLRRPGESLEAYFGRIQAWQAELLASGAGALAGNYVVLRHAGGEYSQYAHLQPGAPPVTKGQRVAAGDVIGRLGSSGSSTEPHLHFQLCDGPDPIRCRGLPVAFRDVENPFALLPGAIQSGDVVEAK